jgi:alanyl-tRNA synthetase
VVGGKAGGKAPTSVGSGTAPEKVDEAVEAATQYLAKFKI